MLATTVNRNIHLKMSNSTSDLNAKSSILDAIAEVIKNPTYIKKFGLRASITQRIDS